MKFFFKLEESLAKIEEFFLAFIILVMILLSILQILLRNFFNFALVEADMLVRALVLWVGFIGASLAVRRNKHINIDLFSKLIKNKKFLKYRFFILNLFSFILCTFLFYLSFEYLKLEKDVGMNAFYNIPSYFVFLIVPISFLFMSFRFLILTITNKKLEDQD